MIAAVFQTGTVLEISRHEHDLKGEENVSY